MVNNRALFVRCCRQGDCVVCSNFHTWSMGIKSAENVSLWWMVIFACCWWSGWRCNSHIPDISFFSFVRKKNISKAIATSKIVHQIFGTHANSAIVRYWILRTSFLYCHICTIFTFSPPRCVHLLNLWRGNASNALQSLIFYHLCTDKSGFLSKSIVRHQCFKYTFRMYINKRDTPLGVQMVL